MPNTLLLYLATLDHATDPSVESAFESVLPTKTNLQIDFNGAIYHFLRVKFTHTKEQGGHHINIHLSQAADIH
jgi:hypothetical protein